MVGKTRGRDFDMVDVDVDDGMQQQQHRQPLAKRRKAGNARTRKVEAQQQAMNPEEQEKMNQFNDLLQEYLTCQCSIILCGSMRRWQANIRMCF